MKKFFAVILCIVAIFSISVMPIQAASVECDHKPSIYQEVQYVGSTSQYCHLWRLVSITRCACGQVTVTSSVINPDYAHVAHAFVDSGYDNIEECVTCGYLRTKN